jgi:hypothetical protein
VSRSRTTLLGTALAAVALVATGCASGTDDELEPAPSRTVTATPSASLAPAPATVPVGKGDVGPSDVVWAQGSVLHVGRRQIDLSPIEIQAMVVVEGGVFVLRDGEIWFTDLGRVSGTGQTAITGMSTSADARHLEVVDTRSGQPATQAYDTVTGRALRRDVETLDPQERHFGPGRYQVWPKGGGSRVVDVETDRTVRMAGLPKTFEVGAWTSETSFFGIGGVDPARTVVRCDVRAQRCTPVSAVTGSGPEPFVFPTGR